MPFPQYTTSVDRENAELEERIASRIRNANTNAVLPEASETAPGPRALRNTPQWFRRDPDVLEAARTIHRFNGGQLYPGSKGFGDPRMGPLNLLLRKPSFRGEPGPAVPEPWGRPGADADDALMGDFALAHARIQNESFFAEMLTLADYLLPGRDPAEVANVLRAYDTLSEKYDTVDENNIGVIARNIWTDPTSWIPYGGGFEVGLKAGMQAAGKTPVGKAAAKVVKGKVMRKLVELAVSGGAEGAAGSVLATVHRAEAQQAAGKREGGATWKELGASAAAGGAAGMALVGGFQFVGRQMGKAFGPRAVVDTLNEVLPSEKAQEATKAPGGVETPAPAAKGAGEAPAAPGKAFVAEPPDEKTVITEPTPVEKAAIEGAAEAQADHVRATGDALRTRLDDLGLPDVGLKLSAAVTDPKGNPANGKYARKVIEVALDTDETTDANGMIGALDHEATHAFVELGILSPEEYGTLLARARRETLRDHSVGGMPLPRFGAAEAEVGVVGETLDRELVARLFQYFRAGALDEDLDATPILRKLGEFLEAVANTLRGNGFRTSRSVLEAMATGRLAGERPRNLDIDVPRLEVPDAGLPGGGTVPLQGTQVTPQRGFVPPTGTPAPAPDLIEVRAKAKAAAKRRINEVVHVPEEALPEAQNRPALATDEPPPEGPVEAGAEEYMSRRSGDVVRAQKEPEWEPSGTLSRNEDGLWAMDDDSIAPMPTLKDAVLATLEANAGYHYKVARTPAENVFQVFLAEYELTDVDEPMVIDFTDLGIRLPKQSPRQLAEGEYMSYRQNYKSRQGFLPGTTRPEDVPGMEPFGDMFQVPAGSRFRLNWQSYGDGWDTSNFRALMLNQKNVAGATERIRGVRLTLEEAAAAARELNDREYSVSVRNMIGAFDGKMPDDQVQLLALHDAAKDANAFAREGIAAYMADPSIENFNEAMLRMATSAAFTSSAFGVDSKLGRMLGSLRARKNYTAGMDPMSAFRYSDAIYGENGGQEAATRALQAFMDFTNPKADHPWARTLNYLLSLDKEKGGLARAWGFAVRQAMISGLSLAKNVTGTPIALTWKLTESAIQELIGDIPDGATMLRVTGFKNAFIDGMAIGWREALSDVAGNVTPGEFRSSRNPLVPKALIDSQPELAAGLDLITSFPGRFMQFTDKAFYHAAFQGELRARAYARAVEVVNRMADPTDAKVNDLFSKLLDNPTQELIHACDRAAREGTFTLPASNFGRTLGGGIGRIPFIGPLIVPFYTTPDNMIRFVFNRTPFRLLQEDFRTKVFNGDREAIAQLAVGTAVATGAWALAVNGTITGRGPSDTKRRAAWLLENKPYSFHVGGNWYTYRGLDPVGIYFGIVADAVQIARDYGDMGIEGDREYEELILGIAFSSVNMVANQTYMSGLGRTFSAIDNPDQGDPLLWAKSAVGAPIPNALAAVSRSRDPALRESESLLDAVREKIPGLREKVQVKRDWLGRPVVPMQDTWYENTVWPFAAAGDTAEPIDRAVNDIGPLRLPYTGRRESFYGVSVDLFDFKGAKSRYLELIGQEIRDGSGRNLNQYLNDVVEGKAPESATWQTLTPGPGGGREKFLRLVYDKYRDAAKIKLLQEYPDMVTWIERKREMEQAILTGRPQ